MTYNLNSGYGQVMGQFLFTGSGKIFIVGDSGTKNRSMLAQLFRVDPDGEARFFSTIDAAVGACTANAGDVIYVMPGHTETVTSAGGLDLDVAGITIIGLGNGSDRPTINFTTSTGADMDVDAANITIKNILFTGGKDALTGPIDVNAADFTMIDCETRDVTGQAVAWIVTDANADRMRLINWVHRGASAAGAEAAIHVVGGDNIEIVSPKIDGNFSVAAINIKTTATNNARIYGAPTSPAFIRNRNSADVCIKDTATGSTGDIGPFIYCRLADNAANITEAVTGATFHLFDPVYVVNADGEKAMLINWTASTDA